MANSISLTLALYDFVPVAFFLIGAVYLARIARKISSETPERLIMVGSALIFLGGFSKATWKLLVALDVGDFQVMSEAQFPLLAPGFLVLLIGVIMLARSGTEKAAAPAILAMAVWKIPLVIVMTLASMGVQGILTYTSFRRGARLAAWGFIIAFLGLVGMGALSSGEQTIPRQWIEQSVNTVGQLGFMLGCILLYSNISKSKGN
jgi:hypothetical protein